MALGGTHPLRKGDLGVSFSSQLGGQALFPPPTHSKPMGLHDAPFKGECERLHLTDMSTGRKEPNQAVRETGH